MSKLKKINPILAFICTALFLLHGMMSAFFITGKLSFGPVYKLTGWILFALLLFHAAIGIVAMAVNLSLRAKSHGTPGFYMRENRGYYIQRTAGVLLILFAFLHIHAFGYTDAEGYHLTPFMDVSLLMLCALIICAVIHLLASAKPMLISLKVDISSRAGKAAVACLYVCLAVCAVVMVTAGVLYRANF